MFSNCLWFTSYTSDLVYSNLQSFILFKLMMSKNVHFFLTKSAILQSAYYHSGGWKINPNLYEEGNVCLSLLNTWTGRGNEVWDPTSSSILQVLVSLQGLVLNSRPYFNEAGYDKQVGTAEGEKNSLAYNENTFLLNCKTMIYLMRRPPKVIISFHCSDQFFYLFFKYSFTTSDFLPFFPFSGCSIFISFTLSWNCLIMATCITNYCKIVTM